LRIISEYKFLHAFILIVNIFAILYFAWLCSSGVTRRGEVRQLPQGAKRQGALGALLVDGLFALHYKI